MFTKTKKTDKILFFILIFLSGLYIISFTKTCSSTDKRQMVKSALVNKKYADKINKIQIIKEDNTLILSKKNDIWFVNSDKKSEVSLPADNNRINKMIGDFTSIQNMYKISDGLNEKNSFGLTDNSSCTIRYYFGDNFNEIIFGNQDFAMSSRYMMSGVSASVYEISNMFDIYLTTSVQSWTEPYIISQQVLGKIKNEDIQRAFVTFDKVTSQIDFDDKLLELRHGGFPEEKNFSKNMFDTPIMTIVLELGNKSNIKIDISQPVKKDEQEFYIAVEYTDTDKTRIYKSYSKISGWTYNKIKEIML